MNTSVSIIIPVYNLEDYIQECLISVKAQTYTCYEVIIVNDGSTDRSEEIIKSFIETYQLENFRLICQENRGLSSARNIGLQSACGEWITFIGGDDWVEPNYLSSMIEALRKYPSDLCYAGYRAYDEANDEFEVWSHYGDDYGTMPLDIGKLYSFGYVWCHLYKKELIERYELKFDEQIYCEDTAFNLNYNSVIERFCMSGAIVYNYRINRRCALTQRLVHPREKQLLCNHMQIFISSVDCESVIRGIQENSRIRRVMWNELYTSVANDILDRQYRKVRLRKKTELTKALLRLYEPRSRKDKLFLIFMKLPQFFLIILVKYYYGNYEKLRNSRIVRYLS